MIVMATRSSTTARVSRNARSAEGRWVPSDREHRQGERDVRGRRDGPPASTRPPPPRLTATAKTGRHDDAARARPRRAAPPCRVAQVTDDQLALELQPGDEEEDGEQPVRGPLPEGQVQVQRGRSDGEVAQRDVGLDPGGVRPDDRGDGGRQQQRAADRLGAQGAGDALRLAPRGPVEDVRARGEKG